ncbi:ankyrin repeat-containing domain protein [Aspergillus filifer]
MAYQEFQNSIDQFFKLSKIVDADGAALYETESGSLLRKIISRNDTALLNQYITAWDIRSSGISSTDIQSHDPFYTAAAYGCLDALRILLDVHHGNAKSVSLEERGFSLLNVACQNVRVEIVKFLLDFDPPFATIHDRDSGFDEHASRPGASAHDKESSSTTACEGQLVSQADYGMVKQILKHDADVQERLECFSDGPGFWNDGVIFRNVTALHIGSRSWNVNGTRALLDYCQKESSKVSDLLLCRDSMGRVPLHWAAAGSDSGYEPSLPENTLTKRITSTFELLVPKDNPAATEKLINSRDLKGATPAAGLAYSSLDGEPIDPDLISLLLAHGCPVDAKDKDGETPLHILARHLRQAHAATMLIKYGAKVDAINNKGNLPLHEAMRGVMRPRLSWDGRRQEPVSLSDCINAQDKVVEALLDAHGTERPREETRWKWKEIEALSLRVSSSGG